MYGPQSFLEKDHAICERVRQILPFQSPEGSFLGLPGDKLGPRLGLKGVATGNRREAGLEKAFDWLSSIGAMGGGSGKLKSIKCLLLNMEAEG